MNNFENLDLLKISFTDFHDIAIKNNYYSDLNFLNFFHEKIKYNLKGSPWFWKEMIFYSDIPINELIKKYNHFLKNKHVYNLVLLQKPVCYDQKSLERIEQYCEYFENLRNNIENEEYENEKC